MRGHHLLKEWRWLSQLLVVLPPLLYFIRTENKEKYAYISAVSRAYYLPWVTQYSLSYRSQFCMLGNKSRRGGECYTKCFPSNLGPKSTNQRGRPVLTFVQVRSERVQELYPKVQRGYLHIVKFRDLLQRWSFGSNSLLPGPPPECNYFQPRVNF